MYWPLSCHSWHGSRTQSLTVLGKNGYILLRNKIGKFSGKLFRSYLYLSIGSKLVLLTLNDTLHQ